MTDFDPSKPPAGHYNLGGNILGESPKAIKFEVVSINGLPIDTYKTEWFPKSQIKSTVRGVELGEDNICVTEWLYSVKDLV